MKKVPKNTALINDLKTLISTARQRVFKRVNKEIVVLYWQMGNRIRKELLLDKRAEYGRKIIPVLSRRLTLEFGTGFSEQNLWNSLRSAESFSKKQILSALRRELSWTHLRTLMYIEDKLQREFYLEMCIREQWSTRLLQERIDSMLYERTAISKKPEKLIKAELKKLREEVIVPKDTVFRDPYVLNFLGLKDTYSEKDLESSILADLQRFITEMGTDFAFLARQKRITVDGDEYYIDLLFYHRGMRRLVVIDLKLGKFKAAYKSQMELYLRWLEKHELREGEEAPVGLILCAEKGDEHVELLMLHEKQIKVAQYLTALPSKKVLTERLHKAMLIARQKEETVRLPK